MKYITIINLGSRLFFLMMIFILVKSENDYILVPVINGIGYFIAGFLSLWIIFKREGIKFIVPKRSMLKYYLIDSVMIFIGSIAGKIKIISNKAILGAFVGMESVAIYDVADKIKQVFIIFLELISQVLFPNVSKNKNHILVKKGLRLITVLGILLYITTGLLLQFIIPVYFESYTEVIQIFWILGLLVFIQPISFLISTGVLLVNGLKKQYTLNLYISSAVYLLLIALFYSFGMISVITVSISLIISALTELMRSIIVCNRNNKLNWII